MFLHLFISHVGASQAFVRPSRAIAALVNQIVLKHMAFLSMWSDRRPLARQADMAEQWLLIGVKSANVRAAA